MEKDVIFINEQKYQNIKEKIRKKRIYLQNKSSEKLMQFLMQRHKYL